MTRVATNRLTGYADGNKNISGWAVVSQIGGSTVGAAEEGHPVRCGEGGGQDREGRHPVGCGAEGIRTGEGYGPGRPPYGGLRTIRYVTI